jgi:hypothetical protein
MHFIVCGRYCSTIHTFFRDRHFKVSRVFSKNILTLSQYGLWSRGGGQQYGFWSRGEGGGHTVGFAAYREEEYKIEARASPPSQVDPLRVSAAVCTRGYPSAIFLPPLHFRGVMVFIFFKDFPFGQCCDLRRWRKKNNLLLYFHKNNLQKHKFPWN